MIERSLVDNVDEFGELICRRLEKAAAGEWEKPFEFGKAPKSDYWRGKVSTTRNWVQLNGCVYGHPSYDNWKVQARFLARPTSGFWCKKEPYKHNRSPQEWSLGGNDVWAISYKDFASLLHRMSTEEVLGRLLDDLKQSWSYSRGAVAGS